MLVNPQLLSLSGNPKLFEEGCLSFPGIYADVEVGRVARAAQGAVLLVVGWRAVATRAARGWEQWEQKPDNNC